MVPEGWLKTNFGAVTEIANGQVDPKVEPYLSMLHIGPENVVSDSGQIVDVVTCKESSLISGKYEFDENAIVYSKIRPNLNKVCRPRFKGVCSADMYPIWVSGALDIEFLLHYMLGPLFYKVAVAMSMRTGMPKINRSDLNTVPILIPPVDEQKKIAAILSTWDKTITTTEQLLANSQQQKKALMQQLLTGKKRLLDENGERFRGEWKTGHLSDLAKITKGKALSSKDLIEGDFPVIAGGKTSPYKHKNFTHQNVITVSASGAYAGYVAYHNYKLWASDCSVIDNKVNSDINFIYQLMTHLQTKIYSLQSGGAQPHVYPKDLEVLKVTIPCLKEQQKIADLLTAADKGISALQQKIEALKQEKKALMQQLLTGKRRVKVDEVAA